MDSALVREIARHASGIPAGRANPSIRHAIALNPKLPRRRLSRALSAGHRGFWRRMEELPAGVRAAMAMANGNRPTMTAEVVAVEEVHEKTVFVVKVSTAHDSYNSYNLRRRYRQFDALHAVLRLGYRNLPELPGKGGMSGSRDQRFLDKRRGRAHRVPARADGRPGARRERRRAQLP